MYDTPQQQRECYNRVRAYNRADAATTAVYRAISELRGAALQIEANSGERNAARVVAADYAALADALENVLFGHESLD